MRRDLAWRQRRDRALKRRAPDRPQGIGQLKFNHDKEVDQLKSAFNRTEIGLTRAVRSKLCLPCPFIAGCQGVKDKHILYALGHKCVVNRDDEDLIDALRLEFFVLLDVCRRLGAASGGKRPRNAHLGERVRIGAID